jgi:TonB-dependent receptor
MTPHRRLLPRPALLLALLALARVLTAPLTAQSTGTGIVSGRVFEGATGRSLQGAVVRALGTNASDFSDAEGRFSLTGLPAGTISIEVEYVGLDLFKQPVLVTAGATAEISVELKSEVLKMAAFEVAEAARGQALAINQQKTSRGIVNIVSEEVFGAMNEGNIGYALARLPGITVNEGEDGTPEGVNIRGLAGEFNSFQIDGNRMSSRNFNTRDLVADGIANIEVIKANTPDRDGDAIGGTVNLISRSAFQRDGGELRLVAGANYLGLPEKWGHNLRATYSDTYGILGQDRNLGVSFTASHYTTDRYYENNDTDWTLLNPATNPTYNLPGFPFYYNPNLTVQYNLRATTSYAFNGSIDFRLDKHHSFYFRPLHSHQDIESSRYLSRPYIDTRFQDAVTGRKTMEFLRWGEGRGTSGTSGSRGEIRYSAEESSTAANVYSFATGGRHELGATTINYDLFYSYRHTYRDLDSDFIVRNNQAARGYYTWQYDTRNSLKPQVWVVNGLDPRDLSGAYQGNLSIELPEDRHEAIYRAKLDWERKFTTARMAGAFKAGARHSETKGSFQQDQLEYRSFLGFPYASVMKPSTRSINGREMWMEIEPAKVRALLKSNPELFSLLAYDSARGSIEEDFRATEGTTAAYGMATLQLGRTTVIGGLRMEHNTWKNLRKRIDARTLRIVDVQDKNDYTMWLPGLHFRHALQPNLILRESYNRSYGRPTMSRLTLGRAEDANGNITEGNPYLKPTTSDNVDVQLEKYTQQGGLYSVALFYKQMKGFYYNGDLRFNDVDATGTPIPVAGGARRWRRWENAEGADNYGVELIFQQKLYFLPPVFRGLTLNLSATFGKSDANYGALRQGEKLETFGFSDTMFNASVDYAIGKFRANVRYTYRSDYRTGLGDTRYTDDMFAAREQVDVEASYRVSRRLRLNANVINLTSRPQVGYQSFPHYVEDNSLSGWRLTVAADYTY